MKIKNLSKLIYVFTIILLFACSSDSNDDNGGDANVTSISLSVNQASINIGGSFTFTVKDNNNNNITSQSNILIDGAAISGSVFTPNSDGSYVASATYESLTSATLNLSVTDSQAPLTSITLSANKSEFVRGETVALNVIGNNGSVLTSEATITVNGVEISGGSYVTDSFGTDMVVATYEDLTSNEEELFVGHTQKVLIEDYTGAWCPFCPRVAYGIELVEAQTENAVAVAIHRGNSSGSYYDPYNYPADDLEDFIGLTGYPTAMLNRTVTWTYPEPNNVSQVLSFASGVSSLGLGISSELNGSNLDVTVKTNYVPGNLEGHKLVVYVLEDGLIEDQANNTSYYGGESVITDFEHNHVLRQVPTGLFGEDIVSTDFDSNEDAYIKNYSFSLTSNIENTSNIGIAAFIVDVNGLAINSQYEEVGVNGDYD